jgi:hypothetical protein
MPVKERLTKAESHTRLFQSHSQLCEGKIGRKQWNKEQREGRG